MYSRLQYSVRVIYHAYMFEECVHQYLAYRESYAIGTSIFLHRPSSEMRHLPHLQPLECPTRNIFYNPSPPIWVARRVNLAMRLAFFYETWSMLCCCILKQLGSNTRTSCFCKKIGE